MDQGRRFLAIDPGVQSFGFAVMEGSERLVDWGMATLRRAPKATLRRRLAGLIDRYQPDGLVVECFVGTQRGERARSWQEEAIAVARKMGPRIEHLEREVIRDEFAGTGWSKDGIATALVRLFPELEVSLPRLRRISTSQDERMVIFTAVSLAVTALRLSERVDGTDVL